MVRSGKRERRLTDIVSVTVGGVLQLAILLIAAASLAACDSRDNGQQSSVDADSEKTASTPSLSTPSKSSPHAGKFGDLGREASAAEVAAWDIDVRPDFKGLPEGSGTVFEGEEIWLAQCSSCHGDFGDSNEVFTPLVLGNVTEEDIEKGQVASLNNTGAQRTTFMKVATVSTLWDYIHRAMPWNNPKSLSDDQVYALLAYLLNLAYIVDSDFELSHENIAAVQARMPNRNGMTRDHGLWDIDGEPDTSNTACMDGCAQDVAITSSLPDHAMNNNGNLREQMRPYGPFPGINTAGESDDPGQQVAQADADSMKSEDDAAAAVPEDLLANNGCTGCHKMAGKLVGPGFDAIAEKYAGEAGAVAQLATKIKQGGAGAWGSIPMPPQPQLSDEDSRRIAEWLAQ